MRWKQKIEEEKEEEDILAVEVEVEGEDLAQEVDLDQDLKDVIERKEVREDIDQVLPQDLRHLQDRIREKEIEESMNQNDLHQKLQITKNQNQNLLRINPINRNRKKKYRKKRKNIPQEVLKKRIQDLDPKIPIKSEK